MKATRRRDIEGRRLAAGDLEAGDAEVDDANTGHLEVGGRTSMGSGRGRNSF